jgi:hypothetical protein
VNTPRFTAETALYKSTRHYHGVWSDHGGLSSTDMTIVPAYYPGPETRHACYNCNAHAARNDFICVGTAVAVGAAACAASGWWTFGISCAAAGAAAAVAIGACHLKLAGEMAWCLADDCCPKLCGVLDPFDPGSGCCDSDETCVSQNDPNSRQGCCPSNQVVCAGKCCAVGEFCCGSSCCPLPSQCCGDVCCPPPNHCCGGSCCPPGIPCCGDRCCTLVPLGGVPNRPQAATSCAPGSAPCGFPDSSGVIRTCCPPGLECCGYSAQFGPDCRTSCLH